MFRGARYPNATARWWCRQLLSGVILVHIGTEVGRIRRLTGTILGLDGIAGVGGAIPIGIAEEYSHRDIDRAQVAAAIIGIVQCDLQDLSIGDCREINRDHVTADALGCRRQAIITGHGDASGRDRAGKGQPELVIILTRSSASTTLDPTRSRPAAC